MKKLTFEIFIFLAVLSGCTSSPKSPSKRAGVLISPTMRYSLNGYSFVEADLLISQFKTNPVNSDDKTAIWLSRKWVEQIDGILTDEDADGFRIYFGKKANGDNTVVIVSTKDDGPDSNVGCESHKDHVDYFGHNSTFLSSAAAIEGDDYQGETGATMYHHPNFPTSSGCTPGSINNNINYQEAYDDVINFKKSDKINTKSEWFPIDLIHKLKAELDYQTTTYHQDGIRIYLAKNRDLATNPLHNKRHSFIIVATQQVLDSSGAVVTPRQDYYNCYNPQNFVTTDNGEQCPNNCTGTTLPNPQ